jgi:16S rRNA (cytosine1402-N4)-methyltransferase
MKVGHMPVLVDEVMSMLAPAPGSLLIDATGGGGGKTSGIL